VVIVQQPDHAGHAMRTIVVDALDTVVASTGFAWLTALSARALQHPPATGIARPPVT
jgi:hypothetical protein